MWFSMTLLFTILTGLHARQLQQDDPSQLTAICGDCWCVPDGGTDAGTCPTDTSGIWQSFPDSYPTLLTTFTETSTPIALQASDGSSDCFPFADSIGALNYDESKFPACVLDGSSSGNTEDAVCAYTFSSPASDAADCPNREYALTTYESMDAMDADDAATMMIHSGACGVCSNAQDLAVRMTTTDSLQAQSITCATQFAFGGTFASLTGCYETVGFTTQCATLWAHFAASNAQLCSASCAGQTNNLFGDPPQCELGSCLTCSQEFEADFDSLAGLKKSPYNAGFNVDIAYPCSDFTRIETFDPCYSGGAAAVETISPAPTSTPAPTTTASDETPAPTAPTGSGTLASGGSGSIKVYSMNALVLITVGLVHAL